MQPPALGVRPPVDAGVHPPRRHRPLVPDARAPAGSRVEYKLEVDPRRPRRVDRGPAQPEPRPRPVRRQLGPAHDGLRAAGLDLRRPGGPHRHGRAPPPPERSARPRRGHRRLPPGPLPADAAYPLLVVHDGSDYLRYASMQTVLDNLIHRLEMAEVVVALHQLAATASSSTPTTNRTPASSPRSSCRGSRPSSRSATSPAGAGPHGRELRRGRVVLDACRYPGSSRPRCCCSPARSRSPTSATQRARPAVRAGRGDRQRLPRPSPRPSASRSSSAAACTSR